MMMVDLTSKDFLVEQEEEWQWDVEMHGEDSKLQREEEFVALDIDTVEKVVLSLNDKDLCIASGVLRRVVEHICPPIIRITRVPKDEMSELVATKRKGNEHFVAGKYAEAIEIYDEALACVCCHKFYIAPTDQAEEVVNVLSNQAECHLRLRDYNDAAQTATDALIIDADHDKSRIRRAKAELSLYKEKEESLPYLVQARHDLKEVLKNPRASAVASETARTLLDKADDFFEKERQKCAEGSPGSDFDMRVRSLDSVCW